MRKKISSCRGVGQQTGFKTSYVATWDLMEWARLPPPKEILQTGSPETLIGQKVGKPVMSLYGTEWSRRDFKLRTIYSLEI